MPNRLIARVLKVSSTTSASRKDPLQPNSVAQPGLETMPKLSPIRVCSREKTWKKPLRRRGTKRPFCKESDDEGVKEPDPKPVAMDW